MKLVSVSAFSAVIEFEPIEFRDLLRIVQTAKAEYDRLDREIINVPRDRVIRLFEVMERAVENGPASKITLELARLQFGDLLDATRAVNTESEFLDKTILNLSEERVEEITERLYSLIGEEGLVA